MAIVITDEMRQAVYEEACDLGGHLPNLSKMFANPDPRIASESVFVLGPNDTTLPHIFCNRCGFVWLVMPESAKNYDDAVVNLRSKLSDPKSIKPVVRRTKGE